MRYSLSRPQISRPGKTDLLNRTLFFVSLIAVLIHCDISVCQQIEPRQVDKEVLELLEQVRFAHRKIENFSARFRATNRIDGIDVYGDERFVETQVIALGEWRLAHLLHQSIGSYKPDPEEVISFYDGKTFYGVYPYPKVKSETTVSPRSIYFTEKVRRHAFFESLGWWPEDDPSAPPRLGGDPTFLIDLLETTNPSIFEFVGTDQHVCSMIVVADLDLIVFDHTFGHITKRVRWDSKTGQVVLKIELDEFEQFEGDLWMPKLIRRQFINLEGIVNESEYQVIEYDVNHVDESDFELPIEPGFLIVDRESGQFEQVPGGRDFLDQMFERNVASNSIEQRQSRKYAGFCFPLVAIAVGFSAGGLMSRVFAKTTT